MFDLWQLEAGIGYNISKHRSEVTNGLAPIDYKSIGQRSNGALYVTRFAKPTG